MPRQASPYFSGRFPLFFALPLSAECCWWEEANPDVTGGRGAQRDGCVITHSWEKARTRTHPIGAKKYCCLFCLNSFSLNWLHKVSKNRHFNIYIFTTFTSGELHKHESFPTQLLRFLRIYPGKSWSCFIVFILAFICITFHINQTYNWN